LRIAILGGILLALGVIAIPLGILSPHDAAALWDRVWPILLFVIAITVVTELASEAALFNVIAERTATWGGGRAWILWLLVVGIAAVATIFLSLDTTAVLVTPVVIVLARHVRLNPLPFAITTVWLANTASLLFPVSNLTNLLAQNKLGNPTALAFAGLTWAPAIVAIVIPTVVIFLVFRRSLLTSYEAQSRTALDDRFLTVASGIVIAALLPALVSGLTVWIPATIAAVILIALFALRRPRALTFRLLPWQLVLFAAGLFVFIGAAQGLGLEAALSAVAGSSDSLPGLLRLAAVGGVGANVANNLPAYLAIEPVAHSATRLVALLIGVNAGPLITPWASLATLLWSERLKAMDVRMPWLRFVALGLVVAPLTVAAATVALWLTS
jgi:arsenical pump membrane protein